MLGANVSNVPDCEEATKNGYIAVSYTHLDVYKRQVIHRFHNLIRAYTELLKEIRRYIFRRCV